MQSGSQSGDGKHSPFGGGNGGKGIGGSMSGNNFGTNPRGNPTTTKLSVDLVNTRRAQPVAKSDINTLDAAPGGLLPSGAPPAHRQGGVGSIGNGTKPFRLGG